MGDIEKYGFFPRIRDACITYIFEVRPVQQAIKQQRHIKVKAAANPFDPDWDAYYRDREKLLKLKSVNEFIGKVLRRQNGECPMCRQVLERC